MPHSPWMRGAHQRQFIKSNFKNEKAVQLDDFFHFGATLIIEIFA